jgi:uncharacterized membrane protein YraQ (UPF0718 family)
MRPVIDLSTVILTVVALALAIVAYVKDPGLPWIGARNGLSFLSFMLPRLIPALIVAGLVQVVVPQEFVARHFGRQSGMKAVVVASAAGMITPGGPMVSMPFVLALANSGVALAPLVAYMTAWSLFGMQRIISWEAPLLGWRFVLVRVASSLAFPVVAGWLVNTFHGD